ncbi:MAG: hypothetical protein GWO44_02140, partial [Thermoplasmata archaeon]|nr:hypothetical protein [Thermoplasmata archaeon]NIY02092.1 hypothetical protein [Thermoplasmata archaeon]
MLEAGMEVVLLTDENLLGRIREKFARPGLRFVGLQLEKARRFEEDHNPELQWWLHFFRRVGGSVRINTEAMDSYIE